MSAFTESLTLSRRGNYWRKVGGYQFTVFYKFDMWSWSIRRPDDYIQYGRRYETMEEAAEALEDAVRERFPTLDSLEEMT